MVEKKSKEDPREQIMKLAEERRRDGKPALTDAEVLSRLMKIRDGATVWLEQCVFYAKKEGIKEAQQLFDYANQKIAFMKAQQR